MSRLSALRDLIHDAIDETTKLVADTHEAVARKPVAVLSAIPPLEEVTRTVDGVRRTVASLVFDSIHAVNRGVQRVTDEGSELAKPVTEQGERALVSLLRDDQRKELALWADMGQSVLNAFVGDYLEDHQNGLAVQLGLRHGGEWLPRERAALAQALPGATGKICVFVHGLACSEDAWALGSERWQGAAGVTYGTRLEAEEGYTALYVRYNSGRHISQNGRELSECLAELVAAYPVPVRQLVVIGHSMGGLVARSAVQCAAEQQAPWLSVLSHVICLGSPHHGAPLEQVGNALSFVLGRIDTAATQVIAKVLNARSAGIKDLRFGSLSDADWMNKDPDAFLRDERVAAPFVGGVVYAFVAAHLSAQPGHPVGELVGDVLVRVPSACGDHADPARRIVFHAGTVLPGLDHLALMNHRDVYPEIVRVLAIAPGNRDAEECQPSSESGSENVTR